MPEDKELFDLKIELKEKLFQLANEDNKEMLANNLLYDLENIINTNELSNINNVFQIISENKWSFSETMFNNINIPTELNQIINDNFNNIIDLFSEYKEMVNLIDKIVEIAILLLGSKWVNGPTYFAVF